MIICGSISIFLSPEVKSQSLQVISAVRYIICLNDRSKKDQGNARFGTMVPLCICEQIQKSFENNPVLSLV